MVADFVQRLLAELDGGAGLDGLTSAQLADRVRTDAGGIDGADAFVALVGHPRSEVTMPAVAELVRSGFDTLSVVEIASWLGRGGAVPVPFVRTLGQAFLVRSGDTASDYGSRAHALKAAMVLAQSDRSLLRRLQSDLLGLDLADDGEFLRHAARIVGAVLAHEEDGDLRDLLARLAEVGDAEAEASMELGFDTLRMGLDAETPDAAMNAFRGARDWFRRAEVASGDRPDATLYRRCLDALVTFQSGHAADDLGSRIDGIKASAFTYTAYLATPDRPEETSSWLGSRTEERVHWSMLALRLGALDTSLLKRAWLDAAAVIQEELLAIYTASRSFLGRDAESGLEAVLRPRVVGALGRELHSLALLDQWIAENAGSGLVPAAASLREEVADAMEAVVMHRPTEAAAGSSPTAAFIEFLPEALRQSAVARVAAGMAVLVEATTPLAVRGLFETVTASLPRNEDYRADPDGRMLFDIVLWLTVQFVVMRSNVGVSTLARGRYLFERDPKKLPVEKDLQDDYHEFMMGTALSELCTAERRDVGGGRADIQFSFTRTRTVAELKRSAMRLTNGKLVERFGLQQVSYEVTNVRYGILMVLDLRDLDGGQPHVSERISVHHLTPGWGSSEHAVVLFRLQGRRATPSKV
ncbi:hypothetical protein [Methylorubrum extorquens]|uniref:hypothetical protein n=1 Tax=Methylorubrum extorquens TaxID=408 RepID=UPI00223719EE|nr:hypothetical protein [Methylorubrum extorquens]UYW31934.1 hypothetical protein OKB92_23685 [Methylorubrum extorquens]